MESKISKAPDILIIHLKRFSYQAGFLEKIEDLITFPINTLDVSSYVPHYKKKAAKENQYELYAIVNHIIYQTSGGHYTSYILNEQNISSSKKKRSSLESR